MTEKEFLQFWKIYEYSFPDDEKRCQKDQRKLLENPKYKIKSYYEQGVIIGFITLWSFDEYTFIEHFAINREFRGLGYGRKILEDIKTSDENNLILEVELPNDATAVRRINFYEKAGFYYNEYDYIQPPLKKDSNPIELKIMSYPRAIDQRKFEDIRRRLYIDVYNVM